MRIFDYHADLDAFTLTREYAALIEVLDVDPWEAYAWLGRLFSLDNDVGEHWFDNWELREQRSEAAARAGFDDAQLLIVDPRRMVDGRDGPCNSDDFRKRFWIDVLRSLDLSEELICDKAREYHARFSAAAELPALEQRIAAWRRQRDR
ncbi:MAG: hypothetical protein R3F29_13760 [Planctomycetota bacterium]